MATKRFFHFEISINVLVRFSLFNRMPILWDCCHYKYIISYSVGIDFRRQNQTYMPTLQGLNININLHIFKSVKLWSNLEKNIKPTLIERVVFPDSCDDTWTASNSTCVDMAAMGQCQTNSTWMTENCRRTCNKCKELITRDNDELPGM